MTAPYTPVIFVNLPSGHLVRSRAFYAGFGFDKRFCGLDGLMVRVSAMIHLRLPTRERFASLSPRPVAAPGALSALQALSQPSAAAVDTMAQAALDHGGSGSERQEHRGRIVSRDLFDPDGNGFAILRMGVDRARTAQGVAR